MKIYIAIWKDRQTDTTAHPFSTPEKAIEFAKENAKKYAIDPDDYEERNIDGWLFYVSYSCESDCIYVLEEELDGMEILK